MNNVLFLSQDKLILFLYKHLAMGITLFYRAKLAEEAKIDRLTAELADIARCMQWPYHILKGDWSGPGFSKTDRTRGMPLKGITFQLHPKAEWIDLFFDPQGNLTRPIMHALGTTKNFSGWLSTQTHRAGVDNHIVLVRLLQYLKGKHLPDLEVRDEGNYWNNTDREELTRRFQKIDADLRHISNSLRHQLSPEEMTDQVKVLEQLEKVLRDMQNR